MQANPSMIPMLEVDVEAILKQYQDPPSLLYVGVEDPLGSKREELSLQVVVVDEVKEVASWGSQLQGGQL